MITIARSSDTDREVLFGNAADRAGIMNPAIVEKDFWVSFTLVYLFHKSPWPQSFIFKGGTSLSKAWAAYFCRRLSSLGTRTGLCRGI